MPSIMTNECFDEIVSQVTDNDNEVVIALDNTSKDERKDVSSEVMASQLTSQTSPPKST